MNVIYRVHVLFPFFFFTFKPAICRRVFWEHIQAQKVKEKLIPLCVRFENQPFKDYYLLFNSIDLFTDTAAILN